MEIIIGISIAVAGWLANHFLSIRAQNKSFMNQIINNARIELNESIKEYIKWLDDILKAFVNINMTVNPYFGRKRHELDDNYSVVLTEFFKLLDRYFLHPPFINRLVEYETLFPQMKDARIYLNRQHNNLYIHFRQTMDKYKAENITSEKLRELTDAFKSELVSAQDIALNDLLICIQNITIGKITGNKLEHPIYPTEKSSRIMTDENGNLIIVEHGDRRYPKDEVSAMFNYLI